MTKLTQKKVKFVWGDKQEAAFQLLKKKLCNAQTLQYLKGEREISSHTTTLQEGFRRCVDSKEKRSYDLPFYGDLRTVTA
ncbi:hypothetical protein Tco_1142389 [Tanacetum coccineum]